MKLRLHHSGCEKLIRYLTLHIDDSLVEKRRILDELFRDAAFSRWVQAYAMYPGIEEALRETLLGLDYQPVHPPNEALLRKIKEGFTQAAEEGFEAMQRRLQATVSIDPGRLEERVNRYLPPDTPLDVDVVFTVDNFNTGMMREDTVFYSVLRIDPDGFDPLRLAHEVHHVGVYHWLMKNQRWRTWYSMKGRPERAAAKLLAYVVAEGIANRFVSLSAVSLWEGGDERTRRHNERVKEVEGSYVGSLRLMEEVLVRSLDGDPEKSGECFRELSTDLTGAGLPAGHYASARMFTELMREHEESIVETIIMDPWRFFRLYDELDAKEHGFGDRFLSFFQGLPEPKLGGIELETRHTYFFV